MEEKPQNNQLKKNNIYEQSFGQTLQEIGITEHICTMHVTQPFSTHSQRRKKSSEFSFYCIYLQYLYLAQS